MTPRWRDHAQHANEAANASAENRLRFGSTARAERRPCVSAAPLSIVCAESDPQTEEHTEEQSLLERAAAGDAGAVRELYRTHADSVHRQVARILGVDDGNVDDVVQQVFLAALDGASAFGGRSSVGSWLLGIATRRALDESRRRWRRSRWRSIGQWMGGLGASTSHSAAVGMGQPARGPDHRLSRLSEAEQLLQCLTPEQRAVFVLKEVEGYTFKEISELLGVGISTLHARLQSARKRLDAAIEESP